MQGKFLLAAKAPKCSSLTTATLLQLEASEQDPTGAQYVPW